MLLGITHDRTQIRGVITTAMSLFNEQTERQRQIVLAAKGRAL